MHAFEKISPKVNCCQILFFVTAFCVFLWFCFWPRGNFHAMIVKSPRFEVSQESFEIIVSELSLLLLLCVCVCVCVCDCGPLSRHA